MENNYDYTKIAKYRCPDCNHFLSAHTSDFTSVRAISLIKEDEKYRNIEEEQSAFVVKCQCRKTPCSWKEDKKGSMQDQNKFFTECFAYFFNQWKLKLRQEVTEKINQKIK